ncbi:hypothetical protein [Tsukamurella sp. PLM1]|uniref:hypothetical protein n=1 Tax=Tsukamurella sp. PLM1 TaxID=2929795 RepID=UPI00205866FB|nr:hypothetical protein [Tsukamurella sp. PLM1]BDH57346.1 hypothetical protein MTP03_22850 [Tsukamurella sp. PLM1]
MGQEGARLSAFVALGTLFYFVATGFVEPLHTAVVVVLGPMIAATLALPTPPPSWQSVPDGAERERRAALWAQLILIAAGVGLTVAGCTISVVGLTDVFVHTDLHYLGTTADALRDANPRLVPFIAHDRAGFGGALIGSGIAVTTVAMWGFRRGEAWAWWTLLGGFVAGTAPAIAIHLGIGYTTFLHLAPVYLLVAATVLAFALCRPYLVNARPKAAPRSPAGSRSRGPRT